MGDKGFVLCFGLFSGVVFSVRFIEQFIFIFGFWEVFFAFWFSWLFMSIFYDFSLRPLFCWFLLFSGGCLGWQCLEWQSFYCVLSSLSNWWFWSFDGRWYIFCVFLSFFPVIFLRKWSLWVDSQLLLSLVLSFW